MGGKNEIKRKIFVSYRTKDEIADKLINALKNQVDSTMCKVLYDSEKCDTTCGIHYDKKNLNSGDSITKFMAELSEADRIVFLFSEAYFKSESCMNELRLAYEKQARDLQPAVVLLDNYLPDPQQEQELVRYWEKKPSQHNEKKGDSAYQTACNETADKIPVILAWLFGKYNREFKYRDRLILKQDGKNNYDETAAEIIKWLDKEIKPVRYNHLSVLDRRDLIKEKLQEFFEKEDLKSLKKKKPFSNTIDDLVSMKNGKILQSSLERITEFLDAKMDGDASLGEQFKESVEQLTGWLLIAAVDDKKLHQCIHELNHCDDAARNVFDPEYDLFYQILVSAFFNTPAVYGVENEHVVGEGEIKLVETGMDKAAFERFIDDEIGYMAEFEALTEKVLEKSRRGNVRNPLKGDDDSKRQRINKLMARLGKFYIAVEKDTVNRIYGETLFNKIGEKFPALVQIFKDKQNPEPMLELFVPGFKDEITAIDDEIANIYSRLNNIQNWRG
ncbi:MAG: hypothetical protein CSA29_05175 [Desulfobacterales bacterium]|nr:MAG: hypothetical protein CSA29_05175 [Desulfobacterales bacterium]